MDRLGNHGNFALILLLIFRRKERVILLSNAAADEKLPPDSVSDPSDKKKKKKAKASVKVEGELWKLIGGHICLSHTNPSIGLVSIALAMNVNSAMTQQ